MSTSISSGIKTRELLNNDVCEHRVEWISRDSDFRYKDNSGRNNSITKTTGVS